MQCRSKAALGGEERDWAAFSAGDRGETFRSGFHIVGKGGAGRGNISLPGVGRRKGLEGKGLEPRGWLPAAGFSFVSPAAAMAKAGEGSGGAGGLEAELTCPICLGLYQEPVSLSCGHDFCRQCIEKVLGPQQNSRDRKSTCPICRARLGPTAELQNNFKLGNITEAFQAAASKGQQARRESLEREEGAEKGKTGAVPCEHCLDGAQPAVKTCLVCEASLCQAHLSKHNAKGFHQEHILVEVGAGQAEERRCGDHGKLLECYCLREEKCVCILCSIAGTHKGHEVITMKEGHGKQLVKLSDTMTELQKSKSDLVTALEELQESENQIKINTKTLTSKLLNELFNDIETELHEKKTMILNDILSNEKKELAVVADMRNKMEQKRDQAEENLQALQKIKEQPDVFLFFKDLKLVTDRETHQIKWSRAGAEKHR
ncbi:probable E3 ubiquitin-protein ligase MID2 isoform X2 [Chamaea fasciata]|uniref:probable E3 ubiquitin-protein ligase MID2 isoform X2 n=1 Tax=Chamaea fasciata TaxID=190680 RepID=UPI00336A9B7A